MWRGTDRHTNVHDQYTFRVIYTTRAKRNKDQLSLTNPRDALHHGERAANK